MISFLFTNPQHHVGMMLPVARELRSRSLDVQLVSLAELRGMNTPADLDVPVRKAIPYNLRRKPTVGQSIGHPSGSNFWIRELAQKAVSMALIPRVRQLIGKSRVIVIPNDAAFPYRNLIEAIDGKTPFVLVQEGIRFDFPNGDPYGTCGVSALCAWGPGSAEHFIEKGVPANVVRVTGTPRLDTLDPASFKADGEKILRELGLSKKPVAFLSNPIETQGFGTRDEKLALFERFLVEALPVLREQDRAVIVKNHKNEDPAGFAAVAARTEARDRVHVIPDAPLFGALSASAAGVVLTSTVGLEALLFDIPIAALEIPGHGFGFEYVSQGAAVGLRAGSIAQGVRELLDDRAPRLAAGKAFVARHLHDRGRATKNVANVIASLATN